MKLFILPTPTTPPVFQRFPDPDEANAFTDFEESGTTVTDFGAPVPLATGAPTTIIVELWEEDALASDDLLGQIIIDFNDNLTNRRFTVNVRDDDEIVGFATLRVGVINQAPPPDATPTTESVVLFGAPSPGPGINSGVQRDYSRASLDHISTSPTSSDFYGAHTAADELTRFFGSNSRKAISDGSTQSSFSLPAQPGMDDVETVVSLDGEHVYATSGRYGTISVYSRNASTGEVGSSPIQVIDAGLLPGASLAMTQASNILQNSDPQFLYVANPAADSIYVYRRQPSQAANYGELTLIQVVTDGLNGVDGIAGVSDLKLTDRNNQPQLFAAGKDDDAIAVFSVNQQTGLLSFQSSQTHPDLDGPSQLVLAGRAEASGSPSVPVNLMVITEENNKLVVFDRSFDGSLTHLQSFSDVADPSAIVTSSRPLTPRIDLKDTVFVASASDSSIAVYERDAFISGQLELVQVLREGRDGVRGIQGVRELAFHPGNQRDFLYAGDGQESLAVFRIAQDELIQLQRLRDGTAGVTGISNVTGLTVVDGDLIVGSGGPTAGGPGGFSVLSASLISPSAIPNDYVVEYAAMEALIVQSGPDNDLVHAGEVEIPFMLNTGAGADLVTIRNTPAGTAGSPMATSISLGSDNDELNLLSVSSYSTTIVNAEDGRDSLRLFATEPNSAATLDGGLGGDTFEITGRRLESNVTVRGQDPGVPAADGNHDVLCFDPRSPGVSNPTTDPETPTRGDGSIKISAADFGVNYTSIEAFCSDFAAPLASIQPVASIIEGQGVTFDARQTLVSPAHVAATYVWSIGPNEGIAQGAYVNLSWDDLVAAGVDDDGRYQVRVTVTSRDSAGLLYSDIATAELNIANRAPTFSVPSGQGELGIPYEFELAAVDPGNDTISTWFIDWGDGSLPSRFFGDVATASHVYATTGSFQISVVGQDEDGTWAFSPPGDVTVLAAPSVRGKTQSIEGSDYLLELLNAGGRPLEGWLIDWGDGTQSEAGPGSTTLVHQFADNGLYEIAATILRDGQTITLPTSTVVSVDNAAPTIAADSSRLTANQGESIPITFRANDPGLRDGAWIFEIDRDVNGLVDILQPTDNLTTDKNGFNGTIELAFASVGEHRIAARVRDKDDGLSSPAFVSIDVQNVPPTIHSVTAPTGREANLVRVFVDATDPGGAQDRLTYQFDFDNDGLYEVETNVNSASFVPADNGTFPVNVRVVDSHGGAAVSSIEVAVDNLPPTYLRPSVSGQVIEGTLTTISVVGSDPAGDNDPLTYFFDLDNDGIFETVNSTGAVQYAFGDDGVYEVPIQIHDDDGGVTDVRVQRSVLDEDSGTSITVFGNLQVVVINGNPTITSIQTTNIAENETAVVTGTFTDPALGIPTETFEGSATWSDGVSTPLIVRPDGSFETSRFFPDDDPSGTPVDQFTVEIVIRDDDGGTSFEEACTQTDSNGDCIETRRTPVTSPAISVANIPPVITSLVSDAASLEEKSDDKIVHISGSYSDIGLLDTHDAIVDWGDGSSPEPIVLNPVLGTFAASHEYATGGVYQIVVTVTDDDTGVSVPASVAAVLRGVGVVDGTLFIVGTDGRDKVDFKLDPRSDALLVDVKLNQTSEEDDKNEAETDYEERIRRTYQASSIERVIAFLCGGDDHYEGGAGSDSRSAYNIRQIVFGGDGRDLLHGGPWNDALLGNAGEDNIKGRDGSGILIGGADRDRAIGEDADDLLIGGTARGDISSISFAEQVDQALAFWAEDDLNAALTLLSPLADDGQRDNLSGKKGDNVIIEGDEEQWNSSSLWLGAPPALYQNSAESRFDVNRDGYTTALDVLLLVNYLNSNATSNKGSSAGTVYDVSNDGHVSPMDVLYVINRLNAKSAEGESAQASFDERSWLPADSVLYMDFLDALGRRKVQVGLQP
ncbi:MAG: dockerin type I domain-containing protein [bacterium]|nr:dockerin type I domain-containing protein [bacterium]